MRYVVDTIALKKKMIEKNISTISGLSTITGIDRNTLSSVINDGKLPSGRTMCKLVDALDIAGTEIGDIFFVKKLA